MKKSSKACIKQRHIGGKVGKMSRVLDFNNTQILGAGGYGIIVTSQKKVFKLLKDLEACEALRQEAAIQ